MTAGYSIRRCEAADSGEWGRLRHRLWPDATAVDHVAEVATGLAEDGLRGWLAFDTKGQAVAFAELSIRRYANGCTRSPVPFVEGIWVEAAHRQKGVGRLLIDRLAADCAADGFVELCSDADIANVASHHAHERWGFAETERVVYFRRSL